MALCSPGPFGLPPRPAGGGDEQRTASQLPSGGAGEPRWTTSRRQRPTGRRVFFQSGLESVRDAV